jgi:hypothetical protein
MPPSRPRSRRAGGGIRRRVAGAGGAAAHRGGVPSPATGRPPRSRGSPAASRRGLAGQEFRSRPPVRRGQRQGSRAAPGHAGRRLVHHLARAQAARRSEIPAADDLQRRRRDETRCRRDQDRRHRNPFRDFRRQGRRLCGADQAARQPRERHHDRAGRRGARQSRGKETEDAKPKFKKGGKPGHKHKGPEAIAAPSRNTRAANRSDL